MKNFILILICIFFTSKSIAQEIYIRCVPKVSVVREGDHNLRKGLVIPHRYLYANFEEEIDLTISDKPQKILKDAKIYIGNSKGKKDRLLFMGSPNVFVKDETISISYESNFESKEFLSFITLNFNYDGGSWVASGNINNKEADGNLVKKYNFSWFGKCMEVSKKEFKKPILNYKFEQMVDVNSW